MTGSATIVLNDPDAFRAAFREARTNLVVTGPGVFRARLTRIELGRIIILSCGENLPRIAHVSLALGLACVAVPTREAAPTILDGTNVQLGDVLFWGPGQRFHSRTAGPFHWGCILFKPKKLTTSSCAGIGLDLKLPESGWIARPARTLTRRLIRLLRRADQAALTAPDLIRGEGLDGELEHLIIEAVMGCLAARDERESRGSHRIHANIMNRFEDIVQTSPGRLLSLSEVCAAIGISGRTLRACCQQFLGMGPDRYLRLGRLNLARRALLRAVPGDSTVKEISSRYAFGEPGRFAVVYRTLFGESPSVTLHRTPDDSQGLRFADGRRTLPNLHSHGGARPARSVSRASSI